MKVSRKLDEWRAAGLLDDAQAARIAQYEEEHSGATQWVVWGLGAVGALTVTTGIISVVSANWDGIPTWFKLLSAVGLMLGALAGAWRTAHLATTWPRDLFLLLHSGLTLATIGLVAQVYHLDGHPWRASALCAVLALPAVIISTRSLLTYVFLGYVSVALGLVLDEVGWFDGEALAIRVIAAAFGLTLLVGARLLATRREASASASRRWGLAVLAVVGAHASAVWSGAGGHSLQGAHDGRAYTLYVSAALFALSIVVLVRFEVSAATAGLKARLLALALFVVLVVGAVLFSAASSADDGDAEVLGGKVLGFAVACALCVALAIAAAQSGSARGTNLATFVLAVRILVFYLELVKDLMTTGAGLIATGLVFIGIAYGWWRLRHVLPIAPAPTSEGGAR